MTNTANQVPLRPQSSFVYPDEISAVVLHAAAVFNSSSAGRERQAELNTWFLQQ